MSEMGISSPVRQSEDNAQTIVAFDFDGTLTIRDSFTAFLRWRAGPAGWALGLLKLAPALLAYAQDRDRGRIKAASVREFLSGVTRDQLDAEAEAYAAHIYNRFMRPDALACWQDWGRKGAHRVIVTASPTQTVAPFARRLGAENLIGTALEFDADGEITGAFVGDNCRGQEKVRRLKAVYGDNVIVLAAYGDTSGDTEMLAMAQAPGFRVFKGRP
jgi:phosphatidylglycerophosphatase C